MSMYLILFAIVVFIIAYMFYGRWLQKQWGIDPNAKTPAERLEDGVDYEPSPWYVVFSHQFSSIAGAGPVTGPIIAAMFGWVPVLLWIFVGGIFFGAVHDFTALYASVKNNGKSIGLIIENYIGKTGKRMFLIFSWLFSLLVVAAFADMVASTFNGYTADGTTNIPAASAASISMLFMVAAVVLGIINHFFKPKNWQQIIIALGLLVATFVIGIKFPMIFNKNIWLIIVFIYLFVASVTPMWLLMQPRDFLTTFMLLGMIVGAVAGIIMERPDMNLNAFNGFVVDGKMLFPTLFITIACGAVSGFHSLVSSGTTSKQIANEKHMLPVGFGAMLVECVLSVVALIVVGAVAVNGQMPSGTPFQIFSSGVAGFLTNFGVNPHVAACFMTMCVSSLALTSLDSVARIGRMAFQELFMSEESEVTVDATGQVTVKKANPLSNKYVATVATLFVGVLLALGGYMNIWALFGSANQLLAALVMISLAVFLKTTGRNGYMLWIPMFTMLLVTSTALVMAVYNIVVKLFVTHTFVFMIDGLQLIIAIALIALAGMIVIESSKKLFKKADKQELAESNV